MNSPDTRPWLLQGSTLYALEEGSFSDEAARTAIGDRDDVRIAYVDSIKGVWGGINESNAYGMIPFENSRGGIVWPHLDKLSDSDWSISAETQLKVRMCAGGLIGSHIDDAHIVCSHHKGLEQCKCLIQDLPDAEERAFNSTVEAVRYVADSGNPKAIALGSRIAIQKMGLTLLAEDVADMKGDQNITQFFVVHKNGTEKLPRAEARHHAALITPENRRGVLSRLTSIIDNARVDLSSIQSRPIGNKQYEFFTEMTREGDPEELELMARQLEVHPDIHSVKWLGSWNDRYEN